MRLSLVLLFLLIMNPLTSFAADIVDVSQLAALSQNQEPAQQVIDLGQDIRRGVEARAQLVPQVSTGEDATLSGNAALYTLSVSFIDGKTRQVLLEGQVAARAYNSENNILKTVRLEPQQLFWAGSMPLAQDRETMIKIGTQLTDGKKRIYRFFFRPSAIFTPEAQGSPQGY